MRILILFLIISFSIACNTSHDQTIAFLDQGIQQSKEYILRQNSMIYTEFAKAKEENPKRVIPWKNKADSIHEKYKLIEAIVDTLKSQLKAEESTKFKEDELNKAVSGYHDLLQNLITDSAAVQLINNQFIKITKNDISEAGLNLLLNKISISTHYALKYLYGQIYIKEFRLNKLYPVVIPDKTLLKPDEYYKAEIFLSAIDTTINPIIIVNKDTLEVINGIAIYKSQPNEELGIKELKGHIEYKRADGITSNFPFTISYKVINQ